MAGLFDELNIPQKEIAIPYEEYFSEMNLTEEQKEERVKFSYEFEDVMLFILALVFVMDRYRYINEKYLKDELYKRYFDVANKYTYIDDSVKYYIQSFSEDTIDTTMKRKEDKWYLSNDRAMLISENEANTILNNSDFAKAIRSGKTKKKWIDIRDKRERETHLAVGGTVKPILEPFIVGDTLMNYPKDFSFSVSVEETANCRCTIKYY